MRAVSNPTPTTEREFMAQVKDLATLFGWFYYHPWLSIHSPRGWPDVALIRPPRIVLCELKAQKGKVSEAQQKVLDLLHQCPGVEAYLWRPSDLDRIATILR